MKKVYYSRQIGNMLTFGVSKDEREFRIMLPDDMVDWLDYLFTPEEAETLLKYSFSRGPYNPEFIHNLFVRFSVEHPDKSRSYKDK